MKILDCANPLYDSHKIGKEQGTDCHAPYKEQADLDLQVSCRLVTYKAHVKLHLTL